MASAAHYVLGALGALVLVACGADGTTAACIGAGEEPPRYNVSDLDDAGQHPDAELNDRIQASRTLLVGKGCLTGLGSPVIDASPDAGGD